MNCTHVEMKVEAYRKHLERKLDAMESEMAALEMQRAILEVDLEEKEVMVVYEIQVGASNLLASQFIEDFVKVETNPIKRLIKQYKLLDLSEYEYIKGYGYVLDTDDLISKLEEIVIDDDFEYDNYQTVLNMSDSAGIMFDVDGKYEMYYVAKDKLLNVQDKIRNLNTAYSKYINMIETLKQISATTKINVAIQDL